MVKEKKREREESHDFDMAVYLFLIHTCVIGLSDAVFLFSYSNILSKERNLELNSLYVQLKVKI